MTRFVAVGLVVLGWLASAGVARAQTMSTPLPGTAVLKFDKFQVAKGNQFADASDGEQVRRLLNAAHCTCTKENDTTETVGYFITLSADTPTLAGRPVDVYVGTGCDNQTDPIDTICQKVDSIPSIRDLIPNGRNIRVPLYQAVNVKDTGPCKSISSVTVWLMVDTDANGKHDHWVTTTIPKPFDEASLKGVDTVSPSLPSNIQATGSEDAIDISWELPSDASDLFYVQAFCADLDDNPVAGVAVPDQKYQRVGDVCEATAMFTVTPTQGPADGMPLTEAPPAFTSLDPAYLCGQSEMGETSLTIDKLTNGTHYKVALVAVDNYGNFTATYFTTTVTPQPVTDFWEDLQTRDDRVDGGCLLSTTYGDGNPLTRTLREFRDNTLGRSAFGRWLSGAYYATLGKLAVASLPARIIVGIALAPLVAIALLWHLLGLPVLLALLALALLWRRWRRVEILRARRLRLAATAVALVVVLAPGIAAADDFMPYWEDPAEEEPGLDAASNVRWHTGIRVGPYTPDIDLQFPVNARTGKGPYAAMFGDYYIDKNGNGIADDNERSKRNVWQVLPMLDVDRIVWRGFGQIGVGGSIGYMQKTANAYEMGTSQDDERRLRSPSAKNTFRLIPLAATVTYRFTYLDDQFGVPVIPYARAGLSYYTWWIKGPKKTAEVCEGASSTMCDPDKAYGGTPGVQVSAGLAIRAERIDAAAARSMRNSGIQHAGFYGEVFWGRVDGFGSSSKLWVGDTTWFAGANFEF
jgi:hypothetical protein